VAEAETVAARKARRLSRRPAELVHHLTFGHCDSSERHGEADLFRRKFHLHVAEPDLADKRMGTAVAALGRVTKRQKETLIAAREILQTHIPIRRKDQWVLSEIADAILRTGVWRFLDQIVACEQIGRAQHWIGTRFGGCQGIFICCFSRKFKEAVGVVECRSKNLSAGQILKSRRNAPAHRHDASVDRFARPEPRQGGTKGPQEENRLDQIAACLLDRERGKLAIVK
jgi:hypothetical protein